MKKIITFILVLLSCATFAQNNAIETNDSTKSTPKVINHLTLNQMMLYPEQKNVFIENAIDNNYSFQPNTSKSLKVMSIVGSTLKEVVKSSELNQHYTKSP